MKSTESREVLYRQAVATLGRWEEMLQQRLPLKDYRHFLREHAGLFFATPADPFVIAPFEIEAGALVDFVVVRGNPVAGLRYQMIRVATPHPDDVSAMTGKAPRRHSSVHAEVASWPREIRLAKPQVRAFWPCQLSPCPTPPVLNHVVLIGRNPGGRRAGGWGRYSRWPWPGPPNIYTVIGEGMNSWRVRIDSFDDLTSHAEDRLAHHRLAPPERACQMDTPHVGHERQADGRLDWCALHQREWNDLLCHCSLSSDQTSDQ